MTGRQAGKPFRPIATMHAIRYLRSRLGRPIRLAHVLSIVALLVAGCNQSFVMVSAPPKHVVLLLYGDSRQPQADGFVEGLRELGYEEGRNVRFTILNAKNDRARLEPLIESTLIEGMDMLVACGGLESDAARKLLKDTNTPVISTYNNSIVERGLVESRRHPGWNVTGVDNLGAEISGKRVELIRDLLPHTKRILLLFDDTIAPSRIGYENAARDAAKLGITIVGRQAATPDDIKSVMEALRPGEVDAMLLVPSAPIDNALDDVILPNAARLKLPIMGTARHQARSGTLASYGASTYQTGRQASRLADKVLRGVPASSLPFETPKQFEYVVNQAALKELGIELPPLVESQVNEMI